MRQRWFVFNTLSPGIDSFVTDIGIFGPERDQTPFHHYNLSRALAENGWIYRPGADVVGLERRAGIDGTKDFFKIFAVKANVTGAHKNLLLNNYYNTDRLEK